MSEPHKSKRKPKAPFVRDVCAQLDGQQPSPRPPITEDGKWPGDDGPTEPPPDFPPPRRDGR